MIRLAKADFRRWLRRNRFRDVGEPSDMKDCPLCRYLKSRGAKQVLISVAWRQVDGKHHTHNSWQREFQNNAMTLAKAFHVPELQGIQALLALKMTDGD